MEYLVQMVKSADTLYADKVSAHKQLSADFTSPFVGKFYILIIFH